MSDPSGKFWKPLLALAVGYLVVALYLVGFHFWAQGKNPKQTLYYGFYAEPGTCLREIFPKKGGYLRDYCNRENPNAPGFRLNTHPPGTWLLLRGFSHLFPLPHFLRFSEIIFFLLSLAAMPFLYGIGRILYGPRAGLLSAAIWLIMPAFALFSHRSPDAFYGTLTTLVLWAYLRTRGETFPWKIVAGFSVPLMGLFTYAIIPILAILGVAALYDWLRRKELPIHFFFFVAPAFAFYCFLPRNYLDMALTAAHLSRFMVWTTDPGQNLANVFVFLVALGVPVAAGACVELFRPEQEGLKMGAILSFAVVVISMATPGEVERCWLSLAPLFILFGATCWHRFNVPLLLFLVVAQSVAMLCFLRFL